MTQTPPRIGVSRWDDVTDRRFANFLAAVASAGGEGIELRDPASSTLQGLDGLLLSDGIDVAPETYGETPHPKTKQYDAVRDAFELRLLTEALERGLPVLAVCRGHQLLNVGLGGRLLQHIEHNVHRAHYEIEGFPSRWHAVTIAPGTKVHGLLGAEELVINSRHHQAVTPETLAPNTRACAHALDGLIEAIESTEHDFVVGVQWHPERPEPAHPGFTQASAGLFAGLVAAARRVTAPA